MNLNQLWDELASDLEREFRSYRSQLRNLDVTVKADSTLLTNADIANQKVWDGLAGLCLGQASGLVSVDAAGNNRLPVDVDILSRPEPLFNSTIMGDEELVTWFLRQI
jgi:3'-phosphoadenosine 5'-phosphosulfate (PAPS) 3'-phosphatase